MLTQFFARVLPIRPAVTRETLSIETFVKELIEFDPKSFEPHATTDITHLMHLRLSADIMVSDIHGLINHVEQHFGYTLMPNHRRLVQSRAVTIESFFTFTKRAEQLAARLAS